MPLLRNILCNRKSYADKSAFAKLAVKSYRTAVAVDDMLYYGKTPVTGKCVSANWNG